MHILKAQRVLAAAALSGVLFACRGSAPNTSVDPTRGQRLSGTPDDQKRINSMTDHQKQALAYAALAANLSSRKDHEAAIANWRMALKEEPNSRQWKEGLALALWRANHTAEAVPIWKALATGNDDIAKMSVKMLKKTTDAEGPKP